MIPRCGRCEQETRLHARGLCRPCYRRCMYRGILDQYSAARDWQADREALADDVDTMLRSRTPTEILSALSVSAAALSRRLYRCGRPDLARVFEREVRRRRAC